MERKEAGLHVLTWEGILLNQKKNKHLWEAGIREKLRNREVKSLAQGNTTYEDRGTFGTGPVGLHAFHYEPLPL